jgi:hypothetical protein
MVVSFRGVIDLSDILSKFPMLTIYYVVLAGFQNQKSVLLPWQAQVGYVRLWNQANRNPLACVCRVLQAVFSS